MSTRPSPIAFAVMAAAVIFQLSVPIAIAAQGSNLAGGRYAEQSDAARYRSIAQADGTPYQDFEVEYPPLAVGLFKAIGSSTFDGFRERLFALQVACQAFIVFLIFRIWGGRAGWSYLVLSTPMLFVIYNGFDLLVIAIAVSGAALARRNHPGWGAASFVVGTFTKIWAIALLPVLCVRRQFRALAIGVSFGIGGLIAWSVWAGTGALGQVLSYRGARGWEHESMPGLLLRFATHGDLTNENGAWRVGAPPRFWSVLLAVVIVAVISVIWWAAARSPDLPEGVAETAAVTAFLLFGTLLSPQFVIWPLPFVAIAAGAGVGRLEPWAGAAAVVTLLDWIYVFDPIEAGFAKTGSVLAVRNLALLGLFVVALREIRPQRRA